MFYNIKLSFVLLAVCLAITSCNYSKNDVMVYKAPEGEALNAKFKVAVNGIDVPVYNVTVN